MGLYDDIEGTCPHCGSIQVDQVKWLNCAMERYKEGDALPTTIQDGVYRARHCYECGGGLGFKIQDRKFIEFVKLSSDYPNPGYESIYDGTGIKTGPDYWASGWLYKERELGD